MIPTKPTLSQKVSEFFFHVAPRPRHFEQDRAATLWVDVNAVMTPEEVRQTQDAWSSASFNGDGRERLRNLGNRVLNRIAQSANQQ